MKRNREKTRARGWRERGLVEPDRLGAGTAVWRPSVPARRADGAWRYRHALRPEAPTALDRQAVTDFLDYENSYGPRVHVVADPGLAGWRTWPAVAQRPNPVDFLTQCCTHVYPAGAPRGWSATARRRRPRGASSKKAHSAAR